jgi:PAS domain S-box-containing protein
VALGSNCRFLQGKHTDPESVTRIREAIDDEEPVTVELRNYRKDGSMFWNRISIALVRCDGSGITNFVGFQQEITE